MEGLGEVEGEGREGEGLAGEGQELGVAAGVGERGRLRARDDVPAVAAEQT